jgi:spermidine synthase
LVGSKQSLVLDMDHIELLLQDPSTANLRRYGWHDSDSFVSLLMADRAALEPWLSLRNTVNTLERPVLEFYSPWDYAVPPRHRRAANLEGLYAAWQSTLDIVWVAAIPSEVAKNRLAAANLVEAFALLERQDRALVKEALDRLGDAIRTSPHLGTVRIAAHRVYRGALALDPDSLRANRGLAHLLLSEGRFAAAVEHVRKWVEITPNDAEAQRALSLALSRTGGRD